MIKKEAIIICLDLNANTKDVLENGDTFFDLSRTCIEQILGRKIFSESKDEFALVIFGTPKTANQLSYDKFYSNIVIARDFGPVDLRFLQYFLRPIKTNHINKDDVDDLEISPSQINDGDFLEALVVCLDILVNAFPQNIPDDDDPKDPLNKRKKPKKKKPAEIVDRRIILFSNLVSSCSTENQLQDIIESFSKEQIKLNIVGVNLDCSLSKLTETQDCSKLESLNKSKLTKTSRKSKSPSPNKTIKTEALTPPSQIESTLNKNIKLVKKMINKLSPLAEWFTFQEVLESVTGNYLVKTTRSVAQKFLLSLGSELKIPLRGYYRLKRANFPQNWKSSATFQGSNRVKDEEIDADMGDFIVPDDLDQDNHPKITRVPPDEKKPTKKTVVMLEDDSGGSEGDQDILEFKPDYVKAYRYGTSLIPFSKEDEDAAKDLENAKSLSIIGFTKSANIPKYSFLGDGTLVFVTEPEEVESHLAFSALVNALYELDLIAVARYVFRNGSAPKIVALTPRIKINYECLIHHTLPYLEDLRLYKFPNFVEISRRQLAKETENERALEEKSGADIIDALIDGMNLGLPYENPNNLSSPAQISMNEYVKREEAEEDNEVLKPKYTSNPYFQRILQCLSTRATEYLIKENSPKAKKAKIDESTRSELDVKNELAPTNEYLAILKPPLAIAKSPDLKDVFKNLKNMFKLEDISKLEFKGRKSKPKAVKTEANSYKN